MTAKGFRTWAKPTDDQVRRMLRMVREGYSLREAAAASSISGGVAARIARENGGIRKIRRGD